MPLSPQLQVIAQIVQSIFKSVQVYLDADIEAKSPVSSTPHCTVLRVDTKIVRLVQTPIFRELLKMKFVLCLPSSAKLGATPQVT